MLRDTLLQIALLGLKLGFDLRARHVKGTLNPADAPSRGMVSTRTQDFTFLDFARYNSPPASVDCCADALGTNVQPGCTEWFSLAKPVQEHVHSLAGKVMWANIPFAALDSILDSIVAAWHLNANTIATVVVPEWPTAAWYRKYLRRKQPVFRLLHRYPVGSIVFSFSDSGSPAPPVKIPHHRDAHWEHACLTPHPCFARRLLGLSVHPTPRPHGSLLCVHEPASYFLLEAHVVGGTLAWMDLPKLHSRPSPLDPSCA